jgi:hypothetical protein
MPTETHSERGSWWGRLFGALTGHKPDIELPPDSLFADTWNEFGHTIADVPEKVKQQIQEEAVLATFNRLGHSLRLLMLSTVPGKQPDPEGCQEILNVWRYELEHNAHLIPDTYCGALIRYQHGMEVEYSISGRCQPGDLLRVVVPCWKMYKRVVIRGEAEPAESHADEGAASPARSSG